MAETDTSLTVGPAPIPTLTDTTIIIEARAVAINPVDWLIQKFGTKFFDFLPYPLLFGFDVSGVVHSVGAKVTRFKVGDRVIGLSADESFVPGSKTYKMDDNSAFRSHVLVSQNIASVIPDSMSFSEAAVLPMGISVAATGLFQDNYLGLTMPGQGLSARLDTDGGRQQWVLITAGSSSIGACAIQLAVAAGYHVVSTSSEANFDTVKALGAAHVIDYRRTMAEQRDEMVAFFAQKDLVGALAIGSVSDLEGSVEELCGEVVARTAKPATVERKFVACASRQPTSMPKEVAFDFVMGAALKNSPVGPAIFAKFLPEALKSGQVRALPPPMVVGNGLESIQLAMDRQQQGVSFAKVVVTL